MAKTAQRRDDCDQGHPSGVMSNCRAEVHARKVNTMSPEHRKLLVVDDDETFSHVLARAMGSRGFSVDIAHDPDSAVVTARKLRPAFCVLDLKLGEHNGLPLITELKAIVPDMRILLLTGYASIATAVEAIKRGAHDYLSD